MIRSESIARFALIIIFSYLSIGATPTGILTSDIQQTTLIVMGLVVSLWILIRWKRGWQWHQTPFDVAMVFWLLAFAVSFFANQDVWRRSLIGLWYMTVYIGIWFAVTDMIANRGIPREVWVDGLLMVGLVVMFFGYWQAYNVIRNDTMSIQTFGVVSLFGNRNTFGAFLVTLTPFALARAFLTRYKLAQIFLGIYSFLAILMLILTFSRGAWLGGFASWSVLGFLLLAHYGLLSPKRLNSAWNRRSFVQKFLIAFSIGIMLSVIAIGLLWIIQSLSMGGRNIELRTIVWRDGLVQFFEKPITGQGFFAYGHDYPMRNSIPPLNSHSHAHNIFIQILAEMGAVGLFALLVSIWIAIKQIWKNWREFPVRHRPALIGAVASLAGIFTHQLFDIPMMFPVIAIFALLILAIATTPFENQPITTRLQMKKVYSFGFVIVWVAILGTGFWSANVYGKYISAMGHAIDTGEYAVSAQQMQQAIDADPNISIYHLQQAFLWGMAASEGDLESAQLGIEAYERFLALEPYHAIARANKGVLHWQLGEQRQAIEELSAALIIAPRSEVIRDRLNQYFSVISAPSFENEAVDIMDADFLYGLNIGQLQFWRNMIPRQYLPQLTHE